MKNQLLLDSIEKVINDVQGKLQKEQKHSNHLNYTRDMQDWLKHLQEKRREILASNHATNK